MTLYALCAATLSCGLLQTAGATALPTPVDHHLPARVVGGTTTGDLEDNANGWHVEVVNRTPDRLHARNALFGGMYWTPPNDLVSPGKTMHARGAALHPGDPADISFVLDRGQSPTEDVTISARRRIFGGLDLTCNSLRYGCTITQASPSRPIRVEVVGWDSRHIPSGGWDVEIINNTGGTLHARSGPLSNIAVGGGRNGIPAGTTVSAKGERSIFGGPANIDFALSPRPDAVVDPEVKFTVTTPIDGAFVRPDCQTSPGYRCTMTKEDPTGPIQIEVTTA